MKSELLSWPVTLAIIVLAFGSLVAAGLPLLLTILGLVSSAGLLALLTAVFDISIWAMNFALMFSLALGIDYALFIVYRFRASLGARGRPARRGRRDDGHGGQGRPVLGDDGAGLAVGRAARAQPRVPLDGARDHAQRRVRARGDADPAARRAREARAEDRRAAAGPRARGPERPPRAARWGERLWRQAHLFGPAAAVLLVVLALPVIGLKTGMPSIKVIPHGDGARTGYAQLQQAFGAGRARSAPGRRAAARGGGRGGNRPARSGHRPRARAGARRRRPRADPGDPALDPVEQRDRAHDRPPPRRPSRRARWSAATPPRTTTSRPPCAAPPRS